MAKESISTDRLLLRRWRQSDSAPFAALCADPEVMRFIAAGETRTAAQSVAAIEAFEAEWEAKGFGLFAVERRGSGDFIGFAGLSEPGFLPALLPAVEIGWRLSRRSWGQGYASEAARAALAFGVGDRGLRDIVSICQTGNLASERIMRKLGMTFDRDTVDPTCGRAVRVYRLRVGGRG